jgi:hypothetical protein
MSHWDYPPNAVPKPKPGCPATVDGNACTVATVSRAGGSLLLTRNADGAQLRAKRARIGRLPRELSRADVSPRYYVRGHLVRLAS